MRHTGKYGTTAGTLQYIEAGTSRHRGEYLENKLVEVIQGEKKFTEFVRIMVNRVAKEDTRNKASKEDVVQKATEFGIDRLRRRGELIGPEKDNFRTVYIKSRLRIIIVNPSEISAVNQSKTSPSTTSLFLHPSLADRRKRLFRPRR